jgi:uncharacterized protein
VVAITWVKPAGAEYASVQLGSLTGGDGWLRASGVAVGAEPLPYHLDYSLTCDGGYVTGLLEVHASGQGWSRNLRLRRTASPGATGDGTWHVAAEALGDVSLPPPGGDPAALAGALDCDLGLSPLTNTMPVLRHKLLGGGDAVDFLMAWVSVPDLSVHANAQRYTFVRQTADGGAVINYSSGSFSAQVTFDADGLVVDYPGIATRA